MKQIWTRLSSESPSFFKKIFAMAITIGSIGGAVLLLPASGVVIPAALLTIASHCVAIGAVAAVVAKFTVKDSDVLKTDSSSEKPNNSGPQVQSPVDARKS